MISLIIILMKKKEFELFLYNISEAILSAAIASSMGCNKVSPAVLVR